MSEQDARALTWLFVGVMALAAIAIALQVSVFLLRGLWWSIKQAFTGFPQLRSFMTTMNTPDRRYQVRKEDLRHER